MSDLTDKTDQANQNFEKVYSMIVNRNRFYRNSLHFLIGIYLLGILAFICLLITAYNISVSQVSTLYIPANLDGTIVIKENLQEPVTNNIKITNDYVIDWVQKNIEVIYDFDYLSLTSSYRSMISLFSPDGFTAYADQIENRSKTLDTLVAKKSVLHGYGCGNQTVKIRSAVQEVQYYPVYTWQLTMPIVARNLSATEASVMSANLTVNVQRVPQLISRNGLAIYGFIVENPVYYKGDAQPDVLCKALIKTNATS